MNPTPHRSTGRKKLLIALPLVAVVLSVFAIISLMQPKDDAARIAANIPSYGNTNALERPALERNTRNNSARTDANNLITAAFKAANQNAGRLPTTVQVTSAGDGVRLCGSTCPADESNAVRLSHYANTTDAVKLIGYRPNLLVNDTETVVLVTGADCEAETVVAGSARQMAVIFGIEAGNGIESQCVAA